MNTFPKIEIIPTRRIGVLILLFASCSGMLQAQEPSRSDSLSSGSPTLRRSPGEYFSASPDTLPPASDTLALEEFPESGRIKKKKERESAPSPDSIEHSPRRAIIYSAILPGLGQAYNKKYFKIPFVYAALGGAGYVIYYNLGQYREAVDAYNLDGSDLNERILRGWRRNLELSIIVSAGIYGLQIIDAYVDANLFYWDVNPDLSIRMQPDVRTIIPERRNALAYGLNLSFTF